MDDSQNEETKNRIYDYLKEGMLKRDAAVMAGISEATFYRWLEEDESFKSRVKANILEYKHTLIKCVNTCAVENGRLALEILTRRFPDDWSVNSNTDKEEEEGTSLRQVADLFQAILDKPDAHIIEEDDGEKPTEKIKALPDGFDGEGSTIQATPQNDNFIS